MGRTLCTQAKYLLARHSLGHLLREDAVLRDVCRVLKGRIFQAEDGIRDVERSRGLGDVYKRQTQGKYLLNRHSLGHLLMADAVLWDVRCVLKGSILSKCNA